MWLKILEDTLSIHNIYSLVLLLDKWFVKVSLIIQCLANSVRQSTIRPWIVSEICEYLKSDLLVTFCGTDIRSHVIS